MSRVFADNTYDISDQFQYTVVSYIYYKFITFSLYTDSCMVPLLLIPDNF